MTPSALLLSRGPDAARLHGLRGRFFPSGSAIFFEPAPALRLLPPDAPHMATRAVEWLARAVEDDGWIVQRHADHVLGFSVISRAFPEGEPDPFGDPRVDRREEGLRRRRAAWDKAHGVVGPAPDAKRAGGLARHLAADWTGRAERDEREQAEAEASDGQH